MGSRLSVGGPETGTREFLREIFKDRERFPDVSVAVDQDRHLAAWRMLQDLLAAALDIERDHLLVERNARGFHGDPWAEGPRGVVPVTDDELHCRALLILILRSGPQDRVSKDPNCVLALRDALRAPQGEVTESP